MAKICCEPVWRTCRRATHHNWKLALVNLAALAFRRGDLQRARDQVHSVLHSPRSGAELTWLHDCLEVLVRVALAKEFPASASCGVVFWRHGGDHSAPRVNPVLGP